MNPSARVTGSYFEPRRTETGLANSPIPANYSRPARYPEKRPGWKGPNAIRSIETARVHHAARRRGGCVAPPIIL